MQFGGYHARNIMLKCEITRPITPIPLPILGYFRLRRQNTQSAELPQITIKATFWTWRQSFLPNDAPRDFDPEAAFGTKFQIPVAMQGGRKMSAPRRYGTDPFHPLGSISNMEQFLCI